MLWVYNLYTWTTNLICHMYINKRGCVVSMALTAQDSYKPWLKGNLLL